MVRERKQNKKSSERPLTIVNKLRVATGHDGGGSTLRRVCDMISPRLLYTTTKLPNTTSETKDVLYVGYLNLS